MGGTVDVAADVRCGGWMGGFAYGTVGHRGLTVLWVGHSAVW